MQRGRGRQEAAKRPSIKIEAGAGLAALYTPSFPAKMSSRYNLEARISTLRHQLRAAEAELARLPEHVEEPEPVAQRAGEIEMVDATTYRHVGRPDLGTFQVVPSLFKEARWGIPIPADGVIKPHHSSDFFWPATRARYLVKEINPEAKRESFDKNIRYIAGRVNMAPENLIKTNPMVVGRHLGVTEARMSQMFGNWDLLRQGYTCRAGAF